MIEPVALTPDRIVAIAETKGLFEVSWRRRDHALFRRCKKLVRDGKLRIKRGPPGASYFGPVAKVVQ